MSADALKQDRFVENYLSVRYAQERNLKQEVEQEADHSPGSNTLIIGNMIGNVFITWPDGCKQNSHTLTTSGGLDAVQS